MTNKQRITQLSRSEIKAAVTGGALDTRIPETELRRRLRNDPREYDLDAILERLAREVGWMRLFKLAHPMKPSEVEKQAQQTIAVIDELLNRFENQHPDLHARADELLFQATGEFFHNVTERIGPDLYRLRAALGHCAREIVGEPTRTGPKGGWPSWRNRVAELLREYSTPRISIRDSKALAEDLLTICGIPK